MIPALFFCARFRRAVDTDLGNAAAVTCSFATSERILRNEGGHLQHMTRRWSLQFELRRDMYHWFIDRVERHVRRGGAERRLAPLHCGTTRHEASAPLSPHEISNGLSEEVFFSQSGPELSATMDYAYLKLCGLVARKCSTQPR